MSEAILEATSRGATLIKQLLTLAQKRDLKTDPVEVNTLIQGLSNLFKGTFPKHIEVTLDLAPTPLWIMADANQITQVLVNLCVNARDAMPDGGTLKLKTGVVDASELQIYDELHADGYVSIDIADTGTGINESIQAEFLSRSSLPRKLAKARALAFRWRTGL